MIRKAFVMQLNAGQHIEEYVRRHNPIWPELEQMLKRHGAHNYSIFFQSETNQLFAYIEIEDEARWAASRRSPECAKWWAYMSDLMACNPDGSPQATPLHEAFHLP